MNTQYNDKDVEKKNKESKNAFIVFFKDWVIPLVSAVIIFIIINRFIFFNIKVPTGSMIPTIQENDRIMVTRVHRPEKLKRGDVVVFKSNENNDKLIKRLIGLPNDTVEIEEDGAIIVNGTKLIEKYVVNQVNHYVGKGIKKYEVPEGHFLFLGDNRISSRDARYWTNPYISEDNIMGKAQIIIFPFNRIQKFKSYSNELEN